MSHTSPESRRVDRVPAASEPLFVYGTLQFPEVLAVLLDRMPDRNRARAYGWRAAAVPGEVYPGLVAAGPATVVQGYLLTGLTEEERRLLDTFEGPLYELARLELVDGGHGWAYRYSPDAEVSSDDWSPENFQARHLPAYIERCIRWRQRY